MKQLFKTHPFHAFCAFTTAAFAQISFGVKAGLNLANVHYGDGTEEFDSKMLTTFPGGWCPLNFGITEAFAIETGVSLQGKGFKSEESILGETLKTTANRCITSRFLHISCTEAMAFRWRRSICRVWYLR